LSAWGARILAEVNHQFEIEVNWINKEADEVTETFKLFKQNHPKKNVVANPLFGVPKRLWERLVNSNSVSSNLNFADLSHKQIEQLTRALTASRFSVTGKSTFKDEFVTAGGVDLNEVDFKTMQSKKFASLHFAGEVLDVDAITGGFNFQAAWTTGWIAGNSA
jgi:predicted Rossmann fold flavoprotein